MMAQTLRAPLANTTVLSSTSSNPRPPKNSFNESERRASNLEKSLLNFDNSVEAKVRKAQRVGGTLLDYNPDQMAALKLPTKRA